MFDRKSVTCILRTACRDQAITTAFLSVGLCLLDHANRHGQCWPSLDTLARAAGVSPRTAGSAVARLRELGIVTWPPGLKAAWNRYASNRYTFLTPQPTVKTDSKGSPATLANGSALRGANWTPPPPSAAFLADMAGVVARVRAFAEGQPPPQPA